MKAFIIFLILVSTLITEAQNEIRLDYKSKNDMKSFSIKAGENIECKLKGQISYHILKVKEIKDTSLVLANDSSIFISKIKKVRLRFPNKKAKIISNLMVLGGLMLSVGDAVNNSFNENESIITPGVQGLAAGIIISGIVIRQIGVKRLKINRGATIKIIKPIHPSSN